MKTIYRMLHHTVATSLITILSFSASAQTTFSGIYTIGGSGANYPTVTAAVAAIKAGIVTGAVTFKINPGIYREQVTIPFLNGASATNTVTFTSSTNKPQDVKITDKPNSATNHHIIKLDNASFILIKNVSVINNATNVGSGVYITNVSAFNTIENCIIRLDSLTSFNTVNAGVYGRISPGGSNDRVNAQSNTVKDCKIFGGSYGIDFEGCCVTFSDVDNKFIGNEINFATSWPIHARYNHNLIIDGNKINTLENSVSGYGIAVLNGSVRSIIGNQTSNTRQYGFFCQSVSGEGDGLVANNMIGNGAFAEKTGTQGFPFGGLFMKACNNLNIIHNSVNYDAADTNGRAFHLDNTFGTPATSIGVHILNNSFANTGSGYAYRVEAPDLVVRSDFNDIYATGPILATWGTTNCNNLQDLKNASGKDASSISTDPLYFTGEDLHTTNPALNGKASYQINVQEDIDKEPRNTETPDIGADEFDSHQYNISVSGVGPEVLYVGDVTIVGTFRNEGVKSLKDSVVKVSYSIDGGNTWSSAEDFKITGLVNYRDVEDYTFQNKAKITAPGTYTVCVRINPPGLASDPGRANETMCADVCTGLNGIYTIGGANPDFPGIGAALAALNSCGLGGSVTFNIRPGTYTEQIQIGNVFGFSPAKTVTLQSETGNASDVIITSDGTLNESFTHTLQLSNAKYVRLNNLTIENTDEVGGSPVFITNKSYGIHITNCILKTDTASLAPGIDINNQDSKSPIVEPMTEGNRIENNEITGGYSGINLFKDVSATTPGTIIKNNVIKDVDQTGILIQFHNLKEISGNHIEIQKNNSVSTGIDLVDINNDYTVQNNYITGTGLAGILLTRAGGNDKGALVANNMIAGGFDNFADSASGISVAESEYLNIYFNSVLVDGSASGGSGLRISGSHNINIKNNILFNKGGGYAYYIAGSNNVNESDFNCLHTTGNTLAYFNGNRATLADLKSASGLEQNSVSFDPTFVSVSDLHTNNDKLDGKATPLAEVLFDFDGQPRSETKPDIGADEFSLGIDGGVAAFITPDPGVIVKPDETQKIKVRISNLGNSTLSDFQVSCTINGNSFASETFSGTIAIGNNAEHEFNTTWTPSDTGIYTLCAKTSITGDIDAANDEACVKIKVAASIGVDEPVAKQLYLKVFPNPATNRVIFMVENKDNQPSHLQLQNMLGEIVYVNTISQARHVLNITELPTGVYVYTVQSGTTYFRGKLIISR